MSAPLTPEQRYRFMRIDWACAKCKKDGWMRAHIRPGETHAECRKRWQGHTRSNCVDGCAFNTTPLARETETP